MKRLLGILMPALVALVSLGVAQPSAPDVLVDASAPIPKTGSRRFFELHESFLQRAKSGPIGVLFLGDSITEGWKKAPHIWEHYFESTSRPTSASVAIRRST